MEVCWPDSGDYQNRVAQVQAVPDPRDQVYKQYLLWGLKYVNNAYFRPFGSPGRVEALRKGAQLSKHGRDQHKNSVAQEPRDVGWPHNEKVA